MKFNNNSNIKAFYTLVQAGLWGKEIVLFQLETVDYKKVYNLAEEQSVLGLIAAGLDYVKNIKVPQEMTLQIAGTALQLEQRNLAMNFFIKDLIKKFQEAGIYALLVKGQGVAQCYDRPLWRSAGDVDLLLNRNDYFKAKDLLSSIAQSVEEEYLKILHQEYMIGGWSVELHGSFRSELLSAIDNGVDEVQRDCFYSGNVRLWDNDGTTVFLPSPDNDVVFIFTHILQHFFKGGIGLKQICDWCRILWTYRSELDLKLLESRINEMDIMNEWLAFAAFAVDYLGMPVEAMPLYSSKKSWERKARRISAFIIYAGNMRNNRKCRRENLIFVKKAISLWKHTSDGIRLSLVFPLDSMRIWAKMVKHGIWVAATGN